MPCHRHEARICGPRKLLTAVQQTRVQDRVLRTRKNLKLFLMSHLKSFAGAIESLAITGGRYAAGRAGHRLGLECSAADVAQDHTDAQAAAFAPSAVCEAISSEEDDRL
jgi:hypothetical protein